MADSNNSYGLSKKATRRRIVLLADELNRACKEKLEHQLARKDSASTTSFLPENITDVEQVDADLFVHFYEIICDTNLIDKKWPTRCLQDKVDNVQAVIDSISLDVLHEDLSHLTGESICVRQSSSMNHLASLEYLLDIFRSLNDWINESRATTNTANSRSVDESSAPNYREKQFEHVREEKKEGDIRKKTAELYHISPIADTKEKLQQADDDTRKKQSVATMDNYTSVQLSPISFEHESDQSVASRVVVAGVVGVGDELGDDTFREYMSRMESEFKKRKEANSSQAHTTNSKETTKTSSSCVHQPVQSKLNSFTTNNNNSIGSSRHNVSKQQTNLSVFDDQVAQHDSAATGDDDDRCLSETSTATVSSADQSRSAVNAFQKQHKQQTQTRKCRRTSANTPSPAVETVDNELALIRRRLALNRHIQSERAASMLDSAYSSDLSDAKSILDSQLHQIRRKSSLTSQFYDDLMREKRRTATASTNALVVATRPKKTATAVAKRSVLLARTKQLHHHHHQDRRRSHSASVGKKAGMSAVPSEYRMLIDESSLLNMLVDEFPGLHLAPATIHTLWQRHSKQLESLGKMRRDLRSLTATTTATTATSQPNANNTAASSDLCQTMASLHLSSSSLPLALGAAKTKESKVLAHVRATHAKQSALMGVMRKELEHVERMHDMRRLRQANSAVRVREREKRAEAAKSQRHVDLFWREKRARMLAQRDSDELIFKRLFDEALKLERQRLLELTAYAREKSALSDRKHLDRIESMENAYKQRFDMLQERARDEKREAQLTFAAQSAQLARMRRECRERLRDDVLVTQEHMCRDTTHKHWRQVDANRVRQDLNKASYIPAKTK